jgi:ribosomal-protein-alanine acetyltransferase
MIRIGAISDLPDILRIEQASQRCPWSEAQIRGEMESGSFFVHGRGPDMGGFNFFRIAADQMEITEIAVVPEKRRQGIGRGLLRRALEKGMEKGVKSAFLEVRETNREARPLYESMGFSPLSIRKAYYGEKEDALVMSKAISE